MNAAPDKGGAPRATDFKRDIRAPGFAVPELACDAHLHIVGPYANYPLRETRSLNPPEATLEDYLGLRRKLGLGRSVIVQPSVFAKDNECTLAASEALEGTGRAVVVVEPDVGEATLARMHARGARGIRVQNVAAGGASFDDINEIAARIQPFGWHIQLFMDAADIVHIAPRLRGLPVPVVFDHMAQVHSSGGMDGDGFKIMLGLLESGRAWVKLSNAFRIPDPARARRLIAANPEHVVWGTDWPHLGFKDGPPDDGELLEAVSQWAPDVAVRNRILVTNPAELYFR